jgi:hypothetical protein
MNRSLHRRVVIELWVLAILLGAFGFMFGFGVGGWINHRDCKLTTPTVTMGVRA